MIKIKILVIYPGRKGGGSIYSYEMTKALADNKDLEISAVISKQQKNLSKWETLNIDLYKIDTYTNKFNFLLSTLDIIKFIKLKNFVKNINPDIVYYPMTHLWTPTFNFLFKNTNKVITLHDPVKRYKENNPIHFMQKFVFKSNHKYILLSKKFKNNLNNYNIKDENILVLPHGIFDYYLNNSIQVKENEGRNILFFGKIKEYKGLDTLLKAFNIINDKYDDYKLIIAGDGNISDYKEYINNENITVLNKWVTKDEIDILFKKSDLVVLPYKDASQSGVIPIAFAYGKPVLATRVGGIPEQIIDGENGILIEPNNENLLAEKIIELFKDKNYLNILGQRAKSYAQNEWDWHNLSNKLVKFFNEIIIEENGD